MLLLTKEFNACTYRINLNNSLEYQVSMNGEEGAVVWLGGNTASGDVEEVAEFKMKGLIDVIKVNTSSDHFDYLTAYIDHEPSEEDEMYDVQITIASVGLKPKQEKVPVAGRSRDDHDIHVVGPEVGLIAGLVALLIISLIGLVILYKVCNDNNQKERN